MAISQITAGSIADGTVIASDIADGTITDAKIVGVANTKITGLITNDQISSVANTKITGLITNDQISSVANTKITGTLGGFESGTVMLFGQTAAPTGWTKDTTNYNNSSLRVVTGSASTGGSVDFTTAFASQTPSGNVSITSITGSAGATTLTTPQIPSHSHVYRTGGSNNNTGNPTAGNNYSTSPGSTDAAGGGGSHDHPFSFTSGSGTFSGNAINLAVKYVDVIRATKD